MSDLADIQDTFNNSIFKLACHDVARIVSILSLESNDLHRQPNPLRNKIYGKSVFFLRFFYLVFVKGFTPTIFDMIPYKLWQVISISIYIYRRTILPFYLNIVGYGRYASWTNPELGSSQPVSTNDPVTKSYKIQLSLISEDRLAKQDFGDFHFESLVTTLYKREAHLYPHSQSPGHPFVLSGCPGNFLDHLLGVYKVLVAWNQPQYIARAGMFHSVYGTFDYRASFFDLKKGRDELRSIIGPASEEIAFLICTSDRIGLMRDIMNVLYGENTKSILGGGIIKDGDGNPYPPRISNITLTSEGFPVRNHITQKIHIFPPQLFADFCLVMMADFMEQGALGLGSDDADICLFQFLRYRYFSDLMVYIQPYCNVLPKVWFQYLGENEFQEPLRKEVLALKRIWTKLVAPFYHNNNNNSIHYVKTNADTKQNSLANNDNTIAASTDITADSTHQPSQSFSSSLLLNLSATDKELMIHMSHKYPYIVEPRVALVCAMQSDGKIQILKNMTRKALITSTLQLLEEWGMLTIKCPQMSIKDVIHLLQRCSDM